MVTLFRAKKLKKATLTQKLLGKEPRENGFIKLNNLLAQQHNLQQLPQEEVDHILDRYDIQLRRKEDNEHTRKFYEQLLRSTLKHKQTNNTRLNELQHLKQLFNLSDKDLSLAHQNIIKTIFKQDVKPILSKKTKPIPTELQFLRKLKDQLLLPDELAKRIHKEKPVHLLQQALQSKPTKQPLNEQQTAELKAISKSMCISLPQQPSLSHLRKCRMYWCVENVGLPQLPPPPDAPAAETCHLILPMQWIERRQKLRYTQYGDTSLRLKIMKGTYWKTPLPNAKELAREVWETQDKGDLYLTNKRLFFFGEESKRQLPLYKIANFLAYENGLDIQRKNGESVFFSLQAHTDLLAMLFGEVISEL